jgi:hypothetical protein
MERNYIIFPPAAKTGSIIALLTCHPLLAIKWQGFPLKGGENAYTKVI